MTSVAYVDWEGAIAGLLVLLVAVECVLLGRLLDRLGPAAPSTMEIPFGSAAGSAARIMLVATLLQLICACVSLLTGMAWTPMLLIASAGASALAFYKLDVRKFAEAKRYSMLGAALAIAIALMSFGRATLGAGMGPLLSLLVLGTGVALCCCVGLISPRARGSWARASDRTIVGRDYTSPETSRRR